MQLEVTGLISGVGEGEERREGASREYALVRPEILAELTVIESKKPLSILKLCVVVCLFEA